ncbi:MAG: tRNA lysidine(34) synthetase TilS [Magnetococcales bacterium]|nr:tRNA lysidine(34) synthetase TilS [Magnetococcales bacterium]
MPDELNAGESDDRPQQEASGSEKHFPGTDKNHSPQELPVAPRTLTPKEVAALERHFFKTAKPLLGSPPRLVMGVSGGSDSMALLHLVIQSGLVTPDESLVAHFDHGLRAESAQEAEFVAKSAADLGVRCLIERWQGNTPPGNLQAQAREARYRFLVTTARHFNAPCIATGHHQDDQGETFLDRLMRGGGVTGLSAMPTRRTLAPGIDLIRPLLGFTKKALIRWLQSHPHPWREDPSNRETTYRRNRIRQELIPALEKTGMPHPNATLASVATAMGRADQALEWMLQSLWPQLEPKIHPDGSLEISYDGLKKWPPELILRALIRSHKQLTQAPHPPGLRAREGFLHLLDDPRKRWSMRMQGLAIQRLGSVIRFHPTRQAPRK